MANRPAMSNPKSRPELSEGLTSSFKYRLENRRPGSSQTIISMSRHHIVDIQAMGEFYDVGRVLIKKPFVDASKVDSFQRKIAIGGPLSNRNRTGPVGLSSQQPLRANFMWSPINLFIGFSQAFRIDDPESGCEMTRPKSMDEIRWNTLKSVEAFLNGLSRTGEGGIDFDRINKQQALDYIDLLKRLVNLTNTGHGRIHTFQYSDWKLTGTRNQGDFGYRLKKA